MTERHLDKHTRWIGSVVNLMDQDKEGKIQVRVFGVHDDSTNIPDSDLLWMKPAQDITSSGNNKMGKMPVGVTVGAVVGGYWLDSDKQHGVFDSTVAKAGDLQSKTVGAETNNGQAPLVKGTNSTPLGGRIANNAFQTRNNQKQKITDLDNQKSPPEDNDATGIDVTENARSNTAYASHPTTASITSPAGSILNQILQVDPQLINSVLPNAVQNFLKIKELDTFGSGQGSLKALGQMLGAAMSQLGASTSLGAIAANIQPGQLSMASVTALMSALQSLGTDPSLETLSETTSSILGQILPEFVVALESLINSGNLNAQTLDALLEEYLEQVQNEGQKATLGATSGNIMSQLGTFLPQIASAIDGVISNHLPGSVLNQGAIQKALQAFSMSQAFIKSPSTGKKQYAIAATTGALLGQINSIPGVPDQVLSTVKSILHP